MSFSLPKGWTDSVTRIRPFSLSAAIVALVGLGGGTLLRIIIGWFGVSAPYSTFFPAVLVTALLAGIPAAATVIAMSVLIAWWAFLPPAYQFASLSATDLSNIAIFIALSGLIVAVAQLYRGSLQQLRDKNNKRELLMRELDHRGRDTYAIVETIVRNTLGAEREKADKGEHGSLVVYADRITRTETDSETGEEAERAIPFMKGYSLIQSRNVGRRLKGGRAKANELCQPGSVPR